MCLLVCWNVKAAVNWHHAQIFDRGLTLCEKATVWYLEGRGKKITFSVEAARRIPAWGLRSHVWRLSGQRRSLLVSTRKVPSHDSDRQHLVRGTDGPLQGASRRRWRSLSFECRRLGERLLHVISSHSHTRAAEENLSSEASATSRADWSRYWNHGNLWAKDSIFIQPRQRRRLPRSFRKDVLLHPSVFCHRFSCTQWWRQPIPTVLS